MPLEILISSHYIHRLGVQLKQNKYAVWSRHWCTIYVIIISKQLDKPQKSWIEYRSEKSTVQYLRTRSDDSEW